jgi:hypothetical protein
MSKDFFEDASGKATRTKMAGRVACRSFHFLLCGLLPIGGLLPKIEQMFTKSTDIVFLRIKT